MGIFTRAALNDPHGGDRCGSRQDLVDHIAVHVVVGGIHEGCITRKGATGTHDTLTHG